MNNSLINNRDSTPLSPPQHGAVLPFYRPGAKKKQGKSSESELTAVSRGTGEKEKWCLWAEWAGFTSPLSLLWVGIRPITESPQHTSGLCISLSAPCQSLVKTLISYWNFLLTFLFKPFPSVAMHISNELFSRSRQSLMPRQPLAMSPRGTCGYFTKQWACLDLSASLELLFFSLLRKKSLWFGYFYI